MLTAGRYLVSGRPDRDGAYRGFTRPTPRKPRKAEGGEAPAKGDARKTPDAPAAPAAKPAEAPANDAQKREPVTG